MDIQKVLTNIKSVDCPVDALEGKIKEACKVPGTEGEPVVVIDRNKERDKENLKAYDVHIIGKNTPKIIAMVSEGQDGYVSTVVDAFTLY